MMTMKTKPKKSTPSRPLAHLYDTARWRRTARLQLAIEPTCRLCRERGIITAATICDHIEPHRHRDEWTFWSGPFQSLCVACHSSIKALIERGRGYDTSIGPDGFP